MYDGGTIWWEHSHLRTGVMNAYDGDALCGILKRVPLGGVRILWYRNLSGGASKWREPVGSDADEISDELDAVQICANVHRLVAGQ